MANRIYTSTEAYDLAFSYRDCAADAAEFTSWYQTLRRTREAPDSALELACGPGRHLLALAGRGVSAMGVDIAPEMCSYCMSVAESEGLNVTAIPGDMTSLSLGREFDLVLLLLNSISHILDEDALREHFRSVSAHMTAHGLYIVEASRPTPGEGYGTHSWREANERGEIAVTWEGRPGLERAHLVGTIDGASVDIEDEFPMRQWRTNEILQAAESGSLELAAIAGDFSHDPPSRFAGTELPSNSGVHPCFVFRKEHAATA